MDSKLFERWLIRGFYGHLEVSKMHESWALLSILNPQCNAWCICGNFNEISYNHKKRGRRARPKSHMKKFKEVLTNNRLFDLKYVGDKYT